MISLILFGGFALFLAIGLPVAFGIAIASLVAIWYNGLPMALFGQRLFTSVDSFPLMAIPLFMLAGALMGHGGITTRIINFALSIFGNIRGSLAQVVSASGIVMGGVSGSGVADVAALGSVMIPEMKKRKYDAAFSGALVACSGSLALILPPSIAIIIYGVSAQASIGDMFMAAIAPGLAIGIGFQIYAYIYARMKGYPREGGVSNAEKWRRFKDASWSLLMPVIIIGGIRMGIFTPTEGGAVVAVYAFVVGMFVYKEITLKKIPQICMEAAIGTAVVAAIIAATSLFGWLLTNAQLPQAIAAAILTLTDNPILLLLLINVMLLIIGMFVDSGPAILLMTPILLPVANQIGVDPVQFGLIMVINLTIGLLTPPVGTALYLASSISGVAIMRLTRAMLPFWGIMIFVLLLVTYWPGFTSWAISK
ncbi:TRAP transporter large permease [Ochrobactrum sp. Marseille-Q0166]|uniref:TRAP transporter large permease n=1 Tax=Ochrobactrum sp. Marseille-Q0166 TaxID=2761105 RepID=UPI001655731A|nr:TRAP transporter large permease [Ochrobactrum sp. Marseille-Q0166]MBC8718976.1 TRAP transporter large permease [Ochrobactrum sp. Marseille-Q0166]